MKNIVLLILGFLLFVSAVPCFAADPGEPDTIRVGNITAPSAGTAVLPVYLYNDHIISGAQIILDYDTDKLSFDSISVLGSRLEDNINISPIVGDSANLILFAAWDINNLLPAGNGLLYNIFFDVLPPAAGTSIPIDSTTWPFLYPKKTKLFDINASSYVPQFVAGGITVLEAPPTFDSVWVDSVGAMAGDQIVIGIYGKNEKDLSRIDLTLSFSSDNLIFNDVIFDLSRSEAAQIIEEANQGERNIHIGLNFGETNPLTPGTGLLATIIFDIAQSAQDELVILDSTSYLVPQGQSLEFRQTIAAGGLTFGPYFKPGYIDIKSATDIDDADEIIIPSEYSLAQNIPNPFNPSTSIQFDLPKAEHIKLIVYNVIGQEVRTLKNEKLPAGKHSVVFDGTDNNGSQIASGIYFYRLATEDYSQSKKMILLK